MPTPTTISGAREALQHAYQGPSVRGVGTGAYDHGRMLKGLNQAAGFNQPPAYRPVARALTPDPRPLMNTPNGRAAMKAAANGLQKVQNSAPVAAATKHLTPAAKAAAKFAQTPAGAGVIGGVITTGAGLLNPNTGLGEDLGSGIGTGLGAAGGTALGALAGPVGAYAGGMIGGSVGGWLGGSLGRSLFPQRNGPRDDYSSLQPPSFSGGQSNVQYLLVIQRPDGSTFTPTVFGPVGSPQREPSTSIPGEFRWWIPVHNFQGQPREYGLTAGAEEDETYTLLSATRVDGQPDGGGDAPPTPGPTTAPSPYARPATSPIGEPQPEGWPGFVMPGLVGLGVAGLAGSVAPQVANPTAHGPGPANAPRGVGGPQPGGSTLPKPAAQGAGASPPKGGSPRTKPKPKCDCNKGILAKLGQLGQGGAADAAQLGLLGKIDATTTVTKATAAANAGQLGAIATKLQTMQAFAEKAWKNTHVDKLINLLTLTTVIHNGAMISRDIGETLGYVLSNALQVVGVTDENDNPLDINGLVGSSVSNFIKSVVGEDVYNDVRTSWQKANRVLQATSNIVWTIRNINDATQDVLEWTAENTGKIGNALKKWGVVGERAYPFMSERVKAQDFYRRKFSRVFDGLETVDDTASSLAIVTSNVREIQEEVNELGEARTRFTDAVSAFGPEDTPGLAPENQLSSSSPENQPIATAEAAAEAASQSPDVAIATDANRGDPPDNATP